jgi:hypothetical protein
LKNWQIWELQIKKTRFSAKIFKMVEISKMAEKLICESKSNFLSWLKVSSIFSIFILHLFGDKKAQIFQDGGWIYKKRFNCHLNFFVKPIFHKIFVLLTPNEGKRKIEKLLETLKIMLKNLILIRHFGSIHHFCLIRQNMLTIYVADEKTNS